MLCSNYFYFVIFIGPNDAAVQLFMGLCLLTKLYINRNAAALYVTV